MARPALILLSGLPGTGKTVLAARLAAELGAAHIESDAVRRELFTVPSHEPVESARVFAVIDERAALLLDAGTSVIIDATNLRQSDRERFIALAARLGVRFVAVRVVAPEADVRERLRGPRTGASTAGFDVYERMRPAEELHKTPHVLIDTRYDTAPGVALVRRLAGAAE